MKLSRLAWLTGSSSDLRRSFALQQHYDTPAQMATAQPIYSVAHNSSTTRGRCINNQRDLKTAQ